jgi:hypothetical protein
MILNPVLTMHCTVTSKSSVILRCHLPKWEEICTVLYGNPVLERHRGENAIESTLPTVVASTIKSPAS